MKMTAIAPWAGCKRNLAEKIVGLIGPHRAYWEPFCGGGAVLLAKEPCRLEILNDLHADITNLMRIVADIKLGPVLYRRLRRVNFCQGIHSDACDSLADASDPLERAYLYFIKAWMSWSGVAGTKRAVTKMSIRYTNNGGQQSKRFHSSVDSIPAWRRRMRGVTILNMDAFKLIPNIEDAADTVIYVDPPYPDCRVDYEHDFPPLEQERAALAMGDVEIKGHIALAQLLNQFRQTQVVVSYYDHPMLKELYPEWDIYRIPVTKAISPIAKRESFRRQAMEVLLVNHHVNRGLF